MVRVAEAVIEPKGGTRRLARDRRDGEQRICLTEARLAIRMRRPGLCRGNVISAGSPRVVHPMWTHALRAGSGNPIWSASVSARKDDESLNNLSIRLGVTITIAAWKSPSDVAHS